MSFLSKLFPSTKQVLIGCYFQLDDNFSRPKNLKKEMDGEKFYLATGDKSPFAYSTLPNKRRSGPYLDIEDLN